MLLVSLLLGLLGQVPASPPAQAPPSAEAAAIDRLLAQGPDLIKEGKYDQLGSNAEEAARLSREINDQVRLMKSLNSLESADFYRSRYEEAVSTGREVVRLSLLQPNGKLQAAAFNNLGSGLRETGDLDEALDYLIRARDLSIALGDRTNAANTIRNIGVLYGELGDAARSEATIREALAMVRELKNPVYEEVFLASLAPTEIAQNRPLDAQHDYERLLALDEQNKLTGLRVEMLAHMALAQSMLGQHQTAIATATDGLTAARASSYSQAEAVLLGMIGREFRLVGRPTEALDYLTQAADVIRSSATTYPWQLGVELSRTLRLLGRPEDAVAPISEALASIERVRLKSAAVDMSTGTLVAATHDAFLEAIDLLVSVNRPGDAFGVAERYRARAFLDLLAEASAGIRRTLTPDQRLREEALVRRLDAADTDLAQPGLTATKRAELERVKAGVERDFGTFRVELRRTSAAYVSTQYPELLGVESVQRELLDSKTALVEYVLGDERSFVWAVTKTGIQTAVLPKRRDIEARVSAFRAALTNPGGLPGSAGASATLDLLSTELYTELVKPIERALASVHTLVVVPDGTLAYVPFESLRAPGRSSEYLIQRFLVSYAPSASALRGIETTAALRPTPGRTLLAVGDPDFGDAAADGGRHLPRLPYTRQEVAAIGQLFPSTDRALELGSGATETAIRAIPLEHYGYVHFATHGLIDESSPGRSGLALATDAHSTDDGVLKVRDIMDLRLNANVVTLSACGTGLGQLVNGEGVVGLTRAFLYAGSRSVVVSLWNVNDAATAELMKAFYANLARGESRAEALRDAKRSLLSSANPAWRRPYLWAPFVLIGEP